MKKHLRPAVVGTLGTFIVILTVSLAIAQDLDGLM